MCQLAKLQTNFNTSVEVAENKLGLINHVILCAAKCAKIDAIILFGSALSNNCSENSDIDLAIISSYSINDLSKNKSFAEFKKNVYLQDMSQEYDFLYFHSLDEIGNKKEKHLICDELSKNGKIIYRKQVA